MTEDDHPLYDDPEDKKGLRLRKLNFQQLDKLLSEIPLPDSYSLDTLWQTTWISMVPNSGDVFQFKKNGVLIINNENDVEHCKWLINPPDKILTIEYYSTEDDFEIEYESYQINFINTNWLILKNRNIQDGDPYMIFYNKTISHSNKPSLSDLSKELSTDHSSASPNYYLILIILLIIAVIVVLMFSY